MSDVKNEGGFVPVRAGLDSDPKTNSESGIIFGGLQAFYKHTQPIIEDYNTVRRLVRDFKKYPAATNANDKREMFERAGELCDRVLEINHAERKIRGLPYEEEFAKKGIDLAKALATLEMKNGASAPDDALAAELDLGFLQKLS